jgi:large subunit ribosomal protein L19
LQSNFFKKEIMSNILAEVKEILIPKKENPDFNIGDNVSVHYKIIEGNKERIQIYRGDVIYRTGTGLTQSFCVRKLSNGVGVERVFPLNSPMIDKIELNKSGRVRRAKIYYIRELKGKAMRIKEKRSVEK